MQYLRRVGRQYVDTCNNTAHIKPFISTLFVHFHLLCHYRSESIHTSRIRGIGGVVNGGNAPPLLKPTVSTVACFSCRQIKAGIDNITLSNTEVSKNHQYPLLSKTKLYIKCQQVSPCLYINGSESSVVMRQYVSCDKSRHCAAMRKHRTKKENRKTKTRKQSPQA